MNPPFYPWHTYAARLRAAAELLDAVIKNNGNLLHVAHEVREDIERLVSPVNDLINGKPTYTESEWKDFCCSMGRFD